MRRTTAVAAAFGALLWGSTAAASPLIELSGGVSGQGGLSGRATGASAASTYFNPALLPFASQSVELGLLVMSDHIGITLDGRPSGDVPDIVGERELVGADGKPIPNITAPTRWLRRGCPPDECKGEGFLARPRQADGSSGNTRAYQMIGLVSHVVKERLVVGFYALVPLGSFTTARAFYNDEREQFFSNSLHPELYSDRMTATSLAFGVGSKLADRLSAGLSFTLNLRNSAVAGTYVRDANDYNQLLLTTNVDVQASVSPHFALRFTPTDALALSAVVHSKQEFIINTDFKALLPSGLESRTSRTSVHDFLPWTFSLGASYDLVKSDKFKASAVATGSYALWSYYLDRHGESPATFGHFLAWKNTFSGSAGARIESGPLRFLVDASYTPTPVPPQIGRSNYVDNDRFGTMLGADYSFDALGLKLRAGVSGEAHMLLHRHQLKRDDLIQDELPNDAQTVTGTPVPGRAGLQTNNPGWPGFASQGAILGAAATISVIY